MADIVRTFVAVEIPGEVKSRAAQLIERLQAAPRLRWMHEGGFD